MPALKPMMFSKLGPWRMAQARKEWVRVATIPMQFFNDYWTMWVQVYRP